MENLHTEIKRPLLRYHGGKWNLGKWIISNFPKHIKYVEPFGGAASVLLQKKRSKIEVYNDLDSEIVNLFQVLRNDGNTLIEKLKLTPFSRFEFKQSQIPAVNEVEKARRLIVRSYMSFSPTAVQQNICPGFRCSKINYKANPVLAWNNYPDVLETIIERLKNVLIENIDAIKLMQNQDGRETLHYVDPPYVLNTRYKKGNTSVYNYEMTDLQHIELLEVLKNLKGTVVLSGYDNYLYNNYLSDWKKVYKETFADKAKKRTEVLWINKVENRNNLFSASE